MTFSEEQFLGGFAGGLLESSGVIGYGVYATSERIIIVNLKKTDPRHFLGGVMAGFVKGDLMPKLGADENLSVLQELNEKKELDISKPNISRIRLKGPNWYGKGEIVITSKDGQEVKVATRAKVALERLKQLMSVFYPEILVTG